MREVSPKLSFTFYMKHAVIIYINRFKGLEENVWCTDTILLEMRKQTDSFFVQWKKSECSRFSLAVFTACWFLLMKQP